MTETLLNAFPPRRQRNERTHRDCSILVLFNPLAQSRADIVCVLVGDLALKVVRLSDKTAPAQQIAPVFAVNNGQVQEVERTYVVCDSRESKRP